MARARRPHGQGGWVGAKIFMRVAPQAAEPEARLSEMEELEEI